MLALDEMLKLNERTLVWLAPCCDVDGAIGAGLEAAELVLGLGAPPRTLEAASLFAHPTDTPCVDVMGIAKHWDPASQVATTKLPAELQLPTLPEIQAI